MFFLFFSGPRSGGQCDYITTPHTFTDWTMRDIHTKKFKQGITFAVKTHMKAIIGLKPNSRSSEYYSIQIGTTASNKHIAVYKLESGKHYPIHKATGINPKCEFVLNSKSSKHILLTIQFYRAKWRVQRFLAEI